MSHIVHRCIVAFDQRIVSNRSRYHNFFFISLSFQINILPLKLYLLVVTALSSGWVRTALIVLCSNMRPFIVTTRAVASRSLLVN